jgi:hypothetical protein
LTMFSRVCCFHDTAIASLYGMRSSRTERGPKWWQPAWLIRISRIGRIGRRRDFMDRYYHCSGDRPRQHMGGSITLSRVGFNEYSVFAGHGVKRIAFEQFFGVSPCRPAFPEHPGDSATLASPSLSYVSGLSRTASRSSYSCLSMTCRRSVRRPSRRSPTTRSAIAPGGILPV